MDKDKQIAEIFKALSDVPVGGVKEDFTISTMKDKYTDMFICTIAKHLVASDYCKRSEVVQEILEEVSEKLGPTMSALFCIGETLVDVSKSHIDEKQAINQIRKYLDKAICSRYQLKKALEEIQKKI